MLEAPGVTSGYSGTPLARKLGIKEGAVVGLVAAPDSFLDTLAPVPAHVDFVSGNAEIVIVFAAKPGDLASRFMAAMERIPADGAIWVAWPKKTSSVPSEITENDLRDILLPTGLVDNKVCAIDADWSGLRFVVRKEKRADWHT